MPTIARIAYLGPRGTFAETALHLLPEAAHADLLPCPSVVAAIDAVRDGAADAAAVPLENSIEGSVPATLDELAHGSPLFVVREMVLPVGFSFAARAETATEDVRTVATHPHAEAQTRRWLAATVPAARIELVGSTAGAAEAVGRGEFDAAICAPAAVAFYHLVELASGVADNPNAYTRFVLLAARQHVPCRTGNDKTTLVADIRDNHTGALLEVLTEFASRGVNLTRIESRPTRALLGQYCFSLDCEGHLDDARVGDALAACKRVCADVRFLGSYPRAAGAPSPLPDGRSDADFAAAERWLSRLRSAK